MIRFRVGWRWISRISVSSTMKVAAEADRLRREGVDVVDFGAPLGRPVVVFGKWRGEARGRLVVVERITGGRYRRVAVDDKTFADLQLQWPFPRSLHARVVDRLREAVPMPKRADTMRAPTSLTPKDA